MVLKINLPLIQIFWGELICLDLLKSYVLKSIEIIIIFFIGILFTLYILKPVYESRGIQFNGNVWVNWFGVSYILFVLYSLIVGLYLFKENELFKKRLKSLSFWIFSIVSIFIVFFPFIKGENPFWNLSESGHFSWYFPRCIRNKLYRSWEGFI